MISYRVSLNNVPPRIVLSIKREHYSNFGTFVNPSLVNVPGHYLRKYGISVEKEWADAFDQSVHFCLPFSYLTGINETKTPRVLNFVALAASEKISDSVYLKKTIFCFRWQYCYFSFIFIFIWSVTLKISRKVLKNFTSKN